MHWWYIFHEYFNPKKSLSQEGISRNRWVLFRDYNSHPGLRLSCWFLCKQPKLQRAWGHPGRVVFSYLGSQITNRKINKENVDTSLGTSENILGLGLVCLLPCIQQKMLASVLAPSISTLIFGSTGWFKKLLLQALYTSGSLCLGHQRWRHGEVVSYLQSLLSSIIIIILESKWINIIRDLSFGDF